MRTFLLKQKEVTSFHFLQDFVQALDFHTIKSGYMVTLVGQGHRISKKVDLEMVDLDQLKEITEFLVIGLKIISAFLSGLPDNWKTVFLFLFGTHGPIIAVPLLQMLQTGLLMAKLSNRMTLTGVLPKTGKNPEEIIILKT